MMLRTAIPAACFAASCFACQAPAERVIEPRADAYRFPDTKPVRYRLDLSARYHSSLFGFTYRKAPSMSMTLSVSVESRVDEVFQLRLRAVEVSVSNDDPLVKPWLEPVLSSLDRRQGVDLYYRTDGCLLSAGPAGADPWVPGDAEQAWAEFLLLPVLVSVTAARPTNGVVRLGPVSVGWDREETEEAGDGTRRFTRRARFRDGVSGTAYGSAHVEQQVSRALGLLLSNRLEATLDWRMPYKQGFLQVEVPVHLELRATLRLLPAT